MLSFAEEIYLLSMDDGAGTLSRSLSDCAFHGAQIGAVLCELCFLNRLDADPQTLHVLDPNPTGDPVLDRILGMMDADREQRSVTGWISRLLPEGEEIARETLQSLLHKGILKEENRRVLWVFPSRRYPLLDATEIRDVERRLRSIILEGEIPSPRDAVLISLAHACNLFEEILSPRDLRRHADRIEALAKLDLVGHGVAGTLQQIIAACLSHPGVF